MPVFKDEARGTWYVMVRYQDWTGERKQKCKRGFATKREAQEWERSFQMQTSGDLDMTFEAFTELYTKDMKPRLKENTWLTKENIVQKKSASPIRLPISKPCTTSLAPSSITLSASMSCAPIPPPRLGTWGQRNGRKCCSGRKRSTRSLQMP